MAPAIFLPGILMPARVRFAPLLAALGSPADALTKELEVYVGDRVPDDYSLRDEVEGLDRFATEHGFDRFHLYGCSYGATIALAYMAVHGDRITSLALDEPATDLSAEDRATLAAQGVDRLDELPVAERMARFVSSLLRPGVSVEGPPEPPPSPEMAKRPAGLAAAAEEVREYGVDETALRAFARPVYYSYGSLSNERWEAMASRLEALFSDCAVERYDGLHHLYTSHQAEPDRVAAALRRLWDRAESPRPPIESGSAPAPTAER
jgi:pimeloyl-ACP methyl ester carboxylesterase